MASPMEVFNASQTAFPEPVQATIAMVQSGVVGRVFENMTVLRTLATLFCVAVAYDQSMFVQLALPTAHLQNHLTPRDQFPTGDRSSTFPAIRSRFPSLALSSNPLSLPSRNITPNGSLASYHVSASFTNSSSSLRHATWRAKCSIVRPM